MKAFFLTKEDLSRVWARDVIEETARMLAESPWCLCECVQDVISGQKPYTASGMRQAREIREDIIYAVLLLNPDGLNTQDMINVVYNRMLALTSLLPIFLSSAVAADDDALIMDMSASILRNQWVSGLSAVAKAKAHDVDSVWRIQTVATALVEGAHAGHSVELPRDIYHAIDCGLDAMELMLWSATKPKQSYSVDRRLMDGFRAPDGSVTCGDNNSLKNTGANGIFTLIAGVAKCVRKALSITFRIFK